MEPNATTDPLEVHPGEYHQRLTLNRANIFAPDSWLSKSAVWELAESSLYKWRYHHEPREETDAMRWGTLIDCLTTTPELFDDLLAVCPYDSFRTNEAKAWREEQERTGKTIVKEEELEEAQKAARMLTVVHEESAEIFASSDRQVILTGKMQGVNIKGLVDLAPRKKSFIGDLKTTGKFTQDGIEKTTGSLGYHVQAGIYLPLWNSQHPDDKRDEFKIVWQDQKPPYEVAVIPLHPEEIRAGFRFFKSQVRRLVHAAKTNSWPMAFAGNLAPLRRSTWQSIREEEALEELEANLPE